jgi:hypothetical protein
LCFYNRAAGLEFWSVHTNLLQGRAATTSTYSLKLSFISLRLAMTIPSGVFGEAFVALLRFAVSTIQTYIGHQPT